MIEPLEPRIAPAAIFSFTDVDGDRVKIVTSKGTNAELASAVNLTNAAMPAIGKGHELQALNLGASFAGATVTITATPSTDLAGAGHPVEGDGFTNVGLINAPTIDLASVKIAGDLGKILVGDDNSTNTKVGLGSLTVQSMGKYGTSTQFGLTPDLVSRFENGVGTITIAGDVTGAFLHATATGALATAKIASITIKGSLIGAAGNDTGEVMASDGIGHVVIGGNIVGGAGTQSGRIGTGVGGSIGTVKVGGTISGGSNNASGAIESGAGIGSVLIKGDVTGGSAFRAGVIHAATSITSVTVGGSVIGGTYVETGGIESDGTLGSVKITGDLRGTDFTSSSDFKHTAFVMADGSISGTVFVGGSIVAGHESGGGTLSFSGAIQAGKDLGAVTVAGALVGNSATPVIISGLGKTAKTTTDLAIKSVTVGGTANQVLIEGGYNLAGVGADGDAQIGAIKIGGDLVASSIIAGIKSNNPQFGNADDSVITTSNSATIISKIASVTVGGQIVGTVAANDTFAIEAQQIGALKTGVVNLPLQAGAANDDFRLSQTTGHDVHVREFSST